MVFIHAAIDLVKDSIVFKSLLALLVISTYPLVAVVYNLCFHPLAGRFPGPKIWAASRLPFVYALLTGTLVQRQREIHEKYGEIVRLAPDEVSFSNEKSWDDIYAFRRGHKRAVRDKAFFSGKLFRYSAAIECSTDLAKLRMMTLITSSPQTTPSSTCVSVDFLATLSPKMPSVLSTHYFNDMRTFLSLNSDLWSTTGKTAQRSST
jgi:hypothetical protein